MQKSVWQNAEYLQGSLVEEDKGWESRSAYTPEPDQVTWKEQIPTAKDANRKKRDFPNRVSSVHTIYAR